MKLPKSKENIPDLTKILFILDISSSDIKKNIVINNYVFYKLIKFLKAKVTKIRYIKYYEDIEDGILINDLLERDLIILQERNKIEITELNTIIITGDGKGLVELAKTHYKDTYNEI